MSSRADEGVRVLRPKTGGCNTEAAAAMLSRLTDSSVAWPQATRGPCRVAGEPDGADTASQAVWTVCSAVAPPLLSVGQSPVDRQRVFEGWNQGWRGFSANPELVAAGSRRRPCKTLTPRRGRDDVGHADGNSGVRGAYLRSPLLRKPVLRSLTRCSLLGGGARVVVVCHLAATAAT